METIDQILDLWKKDSEIDITEPSKEILKVPQIHNKFLSIMTKHRIASKKALFDFNKMKRTKWEYYTGKMSEEELAEFGWEPFRYTLKSDISTYLDSDKDLIKLLEKKAYYSDTGPGVDIWGPGSMIMGAFLNASYVTPAVPDPQKGSKTIPSTGHPEDKGVSHNASGNVAK
jgi:hypothetical protein